MSNGCIVRGYLIVMHLDSEVVWRYLALHVKPGMACLVPLVELMERRLQFLNLHGLRLEIRRIPRTDNRLADRLARAALRSQLQATQHLWTDTSPWPAAAAAAVRGAVRAAAASASAQGAGVAAAPMAAAEAAKPLG